MHQTLTDNLVAIAYKTGYAGTLVYSILCMSPESLPYSDNITTDFENGTAHENHEMWFRDLHHYRDAHTLTPETFQERLTDTVKEALCSDKLVFFRCHPDVALKLEFLKNLRVVYCAFNNHYIPERWAYEKLIKNNQNYFPMDVFKTILKTDQDVDITVNRRIYRNLLIRQTQYQTAAPADFLPEFSGRIFTINMERFLAADYDHYTELAKFMDLTPIVKSEFQDIIQRYNGRQWKRF